MLQCCFLYDRTGVESGDWGWVRNFIILIMLEVQQIMYANYLEPYPAKGYYYD
jgi:hypothetical protein